MFKRIFINDQRASELPKSVVRAARPSASFPGLWILLPGEPDGGIRQ